MFDVTWKVQMNLYICHMSISPMTQLSALGIFRTTTVTPEQLANWTFQQASDWCVALNLLPRSNMFRIEDLERSQREPGRGYIKIGALVMNLDIRLGPRTFRFWKIDSVEPEFGFDPTLGPHAVSDQLPPSADHLSLATFLGRWHPHTFQQPFGKQVGEFPAISPVSLNVITILLRDKARRSHNALCPILDQSVVQPEAIVARLVNYLLVISGIPGQHLFQRFPVSRDTRTEKLEILRSDRHMPRFRVQTDTDKYSVPFFTSFLVSCL